MFILLVSSPLAKEHLMALKNSKLFQCFISHIATFETEIKLYEPLKEFENYLEIISATVNMLEIICELQ